MLLKCATATAVAADRSRFFFCNDTATTEIYTLSLHDALPISRAGGRGTARASRGGRSRRTRSGASASPRSRRSEEHTSELQSRQYLVCRLLLEKKKKTLLPLVVVKKKDKTNK